MCHNFTKREVGDQGLPDPYSSASVSSNEGQQSLPLATLALLYWAHWLDGHSNNQGQ